MAMLAPCSASSSTMALPIPLLPPVTIATFPFRNISSSLRDGPFRRFTPVDAVLIAAIQHLNRPDLAEVVPRPVDQRFYTLPDAGHQQRVHAQPGRHRDRAFELMALAADFGHGRAAANHGHDAFVVIVERGPRLA